MRGRKKNAHTITKLPLLEIKQSTVGIRNAAPISPINYCLPAAVSADAIPALVQGSYCTADAAKGPIEEGWAALLSARAGWGLYVPAEYNPMD